VPRSWRSCRCRDAHARQRPIRAIGIALAEEALVSIVTVILVLVLVGVLLWALNTYVPMAAPVRTILNVVVVLLLIIWLLQGFGLIGHVLDVRMR
jgi:hypothetical protein